MAVQFGVLLGVMGFLLWAAGPSQPRLVGLGCGPDHLTLVAREEDEFPAPCFVVDTPRHMCGHDDAMRCAKTVEGLTAWPT